MISFHQALVSSHCKSFYFLDQIKSNCMYWLHWKSEKNRTEPNELDELKDSKWFNQTTSFAHWHVFFVFACLNQNINLFILFWIREKEQAKRAKWARIFKTPSWMSSFAHSHVFLIYLLKQVWKYLFIYCIWNQKE